MRQLDTMNKNMVEKTVRGRITVDVLDKVGSVNGVFTVGRQCTYCEKPAKVYVWCREHLIQMARLKYNTNPQEVYI